MNAIEKIGLNAMILNSPGLTSEDTILQITCLVLMIIGSTMFLFGHRINKND